MDVEELGASDCCANAAVARHKTRKLRYILLIKNLWVSLSHSGLDALPLRVGALVIVNLRQYFDEEKGRNRSVIVWTMALDFRRLR